MANFLGLIALIGVFALVVYLQKQGYKRARGCELGGVCCGIAHKLNVPENAVKIGAVLAVLLTGGIAILAYVFAWLIWPTE
jgi:phage shock protein PspC (stress-responsive transcriptional regulator)